MLVTNFSFGPFSVVLEIKCSIHYYEQTLLLWAWVQVFRKQIEAIKSKRLRKIKNTFGLEIELVRGIIGQWPRHPRVSRRCARSNRNCAQANRDCARANRNCVSRWGWPQANWNHVSVEVGPGWIKIVSPVEVGLWQIEIASLARSWPRTNWTALDESWLCRASRDRRQGRLVAFQMKNQQLLGSLGCKRDP
jgi:hypothetical protein